MPQAALIVYGAALLLAAARGNAGCEALALSNHLLRRTVRCLTVFSRIDAVERRNVLAGIRVPRAGAGRPRTRPDRIVADKAYSSRANRALLRRRGIAHTIPERGDQRANRVRRGQRGGRP